MAERFVGRDWDLASLDRVLDEVKDGGDHPGRAVLLRGRRRVGKSRLVEEFCARSGLPYAFITATGDSREQDVDQFREAMAAAGFPLDAGLDATATWSSVLRAVTDALPQGQPSILVIDEAPYLVGEDKSFEGALQAVFDRVIARRPILLILIGSDMSAMKRINTYGRPFYQRGRDFLVRPLAPAAVRELTGLDAADTLDACLVTGGMPLLLRNWPHGKSVWTYLRRELKDPTSPLLTSGELTLAGEFPPETNARAVLSAIGSDERTFGRIADATGLPRTTTLTRALEQLVARGVVTMDRPLSTKAARLSHYRVTDPYLRFWLRFGPGCSALAARGRGDLALASVRDKWTGWRGRAIEPIIRELLWQRIGIELPADVRAIGGYWTRANDTEIDIVATDKAPVGDTIEAIGSIKWYSSHPFDSHDFDTLAAARQLVPGATPSTPLIVVSRTGASVPGVTVVTPDQLLSASSAPNEPMSE